MKIINILGILIMTLAGTFGAMFFKRAATALDMKAPLGILKNINLYIGAGFYLLGAVLNILLLRVMDYSIVYPMTALTYIWTMIISYLVFKERINRYKIIAIILIVSGAVIINL